MAKIAIRHIHTI